MRARTRLIAIAVLAGVAGCSFVVGRLAATTPARAAAARSFTLRIGDRAVVPSIGQRCSVYVEGGAPELFCARLRGARHQVTIFRRSILVWRTGGPGSPVWSGKA